MSQKIDFVITWVDGNDPDWRKEKDKYKADFFNDNRNIRYRDMELLKYWFRGIEKYAGWVNKIYFVTWGHVPDWLNTEHEKIKIVKHDEFIPKEFLPTFNSCCIELNLHRIKDLSENFVYFNDDMFIIDSTKEEDFFVNGLPKDTAVVSTIVPSGKDFFEHRIVNNMSIINKYFNMHNVIKKNPTNWFNIKYGTEQFRTLLLLFWNNFPSIKYSHLPASLKKSLFVKLWNLESELMKNSCIEKFRNIKSVNLWLLQDWQKVSNNFIPRKSNYGKFFELSDNSDYIIKQIIKQRCKMICLNDGPNIKKYEKVRKDIHEAFEKILSEKCSFEK